MRVAIIPARGGSKRIKNKNIRQFCGKPMIARAITNAINSEIFDRVIVSTDSKKIKAIALSFGAEVPFDRPTQLAGDHIGTVPVISHAIDWLEREGESVSEVCCIYPATPFLRPQYLVEGLKCLLDQHVSFSFSLTTYAHPIQRAVRLKKNGLVQISNKNMSNFRTQDLEEMYHDAGQFYWAKAEVWKSGLSILSSPSVGVLMPRYQAIDIDTPDDWEFAELIFETNQNRANKSYG